MNDKRFSTVPRSSQHSKELVDKWRQLAAGDTSWPQLAEVVPHTESTAAPSVTPEHALKWPPRGFGALSIAPNYKTYAAERPKSGNYYLDRTVSGEQITHFRFAASSAGKSELWSLPPVPNQDACKVVLADYGACAAFDGVGGLDHGERASELAAGQFLEMLKAYDEPVSFPMSSPRKMANWMRSYMKHAQGHLRKHAQGGDTTGVMARLFIDEESDQSMLAVGHIGDSRAYLINQHQGTIWQLTNDHGTGQYIYGSMARSDCSQLDVAVAPLQPGDQLVLVSDGVTGDYGPDLRTPDQIFRAVASAANPTEAVQNLFDIATKVDDTTAVIVDLA